MDHHPANNIVQQRPPTRVEVRQRLRQIIAGRGLGPGDRLPPSRQIAADLGISLSRVQGATADLVREGVLQTSVGRGTFVSTAPQSRTEVRILIGLPIPPAGDPHYSSSWGGRIASALLAAGLKHPYTVNWIPYRGATADIAIPDVDALILMPAQKLPDLAMEGLQRSGKQIFSYNAQSFSGTENFASPDYFEASARIGSAFLAAGRRNMVLLVGNRLDRSASNAQRCAGFLNAIGPRLGNDVSLRIVESRADEVCERAMVRNLMHGPKPPDAIYAFGDPLAFSAIAELQSLGYRVPADVSVVAGSGAGTRGAPMLNPTMMEQPYQAIGDALLSMVLDSLKSPGRPQPGRYIPCRFLGGDSTLPAENAILNPD